MEWERIEATVWGIIITKSSIRKEKNMCVGRVGKSWTKIDPSEGEVCTITTQLSMYALYLQTMVAFYFTFHNHFFYLNILY